MKINKTVSITIFLVLIMLLTTSCYAQITVQTCSAKDRAKNDIVYKKFYKWLNQSKRYVLLKNAIICSNPKALANLYDNIMQRGGNYNGYDITVNVPNCKARQLWHAAHVIKVLYNGKMFKINYVTLMTTGCETTLTETKNQYAIASQVLDEQQYKAIFMN